jgi:outer membrane protein OmpA-like peptidoglycan-associated protein
MMRALRVVVALAMLLVPVVLVLIWNNGAAHRLKQLEQAAEADGPTVGVAAAADESYCTPALKQILRRVLNSCGLIGEGGTRGCQPVEARNVATMSGEDFNALFIPMRQRGGIVQFDRNSSELDLGDRGLVETVFANRGGASYFLVVSRASPDGTVQRNRELSRERAESVLNHLEQTFHDPELERQVGLLWLGEEYAQLDPTFCAWRRSGEAEQCRPEDLNRSSFIAWIDCQL